MKRAAHWALSFLIGASVGIAGGLVGLPSWLTTLLLAVVVFRPSPARLRSAWRHLKMFYLLSKVQWHLRRLLKQLEPYQ